MDRPIPARLDQSNDIPFRCWICEVKLLMLQNTSPIERMAPVSRPQPEKGSRTILRGRCSGLGAGFEAIPADGSAKVSCNFLRSLVS